MPVAQESVNFRIEKLCIAIDKRAAAIEARLAAIEATLSNAADQSTRIEADVGTVLVRLDTADRRDFAKGCN